MAQVTASSAGLTSGTAPDCSSRNDVFSRVCGVLLATLLVRASEIRPTTKLADLGVDELAMIELANSLESVFAISIDPQRLVGANLLEDVDVARLSEYVCEQLGL